MTTRQIQTLARRLMKRRLMLPEQTAGSFRIERQRKLKGDSMYIINMRNAMFGTLPMTDLTLARDYEIQWLKHEEDGAWMSDMPCELVQMYHELARHARGEVLIGGLGLGIVAKMCLDSVKVSKVTVVEQSPDVIAMVGPTLRAAAAECCTEIDIIEADIHEYAKQVGVGDFTSALFDTWQGTGEIVWIEEVVPLRRQLYKQIPIIACWQEDVMINQVARSCYRVADMADDLLQGRYRCQYYAFRKGVVKAGVRGEPTITRMTSDSFADQLRIEEENRKDQVLDELVTLFLTSVGSPRWENLFGAAWDEAWAKGASNEAAS